jgi:hypothetical protein
LNREIGFVSLAKSMTVRLRYFAYLSIGFVSHSGLIEALFRDLTYLNIGFVSPDAGSATQVPSKER